MEVKSQDDSIDLDQPLTKVIFQRSYFRRVALGLGLLICTIFLIVLTNDSLCTEKNLLAVSTILLGFYPFMRWFYLGRGWSFPVFELFSLFYGVCFGLSSLLITENISNVGTATRSYALSITLLALLVLFGSYYLLGRSLFRHLKPIKIKNPVPYSLLVKNAWLIVWLYLFYRIFFINYGETIVLIHQPFMALGWLSNGIILVDVLNSKGKTQLKHIGLLVVIALQFFLGLSMGALAQIAIVVIFFSLIYLNVKKRVLIKTISIFILAFIFMNPIKHEMRALTWQNNSSENFNFIKKADIFLELLGNPDSYSDFRGSKDSTISRIDHAGLFAEVIRQSPDYVPFAMGKTYAPLLTIWIPRFLWPDKPTSTVGNEWAHWYGLLGSNDFLTSYNLPWLVEFYVNFGLPGVFAGMLLCGLGFAWLKARLCSERASTLEYSVGVAILLQLWYAESNLALAVGGLLIYSVTYLVYLKFYQFLSIK